MSASSKLCVRTFVGMFVGFTSLSLAQVECWAPGMSSSVVLTSGLGAGSKSVNLGKPYRYDVFGVGGTLELGDQAKDAVALNGKFRQRVLLGTGNIVTSTAFVELQTGLLNVYPQQLTVKSNTPGASVGPILQYGANWTLSDPKHPATVNLTFHQSGSSLLTSLLPGLLEPSYSNLNPKGTFYVLGEYHAAPPVMTGALDVAAQSVLNGCSVSYTYNIQKNENTTYRPPLLGVLLGSTNVTILGTPPASSTGGQGSGGVQVAVTIDPNQVMVAINLSAGQGNGWKKTTVSQ